MKKKSITILVVVGVVVFVTFDSALGYRYQ